MLRKLFAKWNYLKSQPAFQRVPLKVLFRLVLWRILCLIRKSASVDLPALGIKQMFLPPQWRGVAKLLFAFRDEYEPELVLLERFLLQGCVMVDVGANYGIYALSASRLVGDTGLVLAFEPCAKSFAVLKQNCSQNNAHNVKSFLLALSDQKGEALLYHHPDPGRNSFASVGSQAEEHEVVQTQTLDSVLCELGINRVDFIKIDVEGAEELVLSGAQSILKSSHPYVLFEYNPHASRALGLCSDGAYKYLASLGYTLYQLRNGDLFPASIEELTGGNVFAVYKGDERCTS